MADRGHELTDGLLDELEKRIKEEYEKAVADAERKYAAWLKKFTRQKEEQRALYEAGQITKTEYQNWCYRHMMMGKEWEKMRDTLAHDLHNASVTASKMARETAPDALALNMNYGTYMIENGGKIDTGFSLYNHDTAEVLLRDEKIQLMPGPSTKKAAEIAANKDLQWNMRHIDSAVIQGVLQGESPYDIARRLSQVGQMDYNASVRYARTMITSAQNAGRYQAFRRADKLGVQLTIEWQATLDGRTRHDHRMMHGQRRNVDEPFETSDGFKIMWPADCSSGSSDAPQSEIWNCRCTLLSWVKGFEGDTVTSSPKMGSMSFEEWQQAKEMPDTAADRAQFQEYKKLLGKDAPASYNAFQELKYNDKTAWATLKEEARMERTIRSAPCTLTKQKFTRFFLEPSGKHSADFFGVGYTESDVRLLRYDIARQFNIANAVEQAKTADGKDRFNTYMMLGVTEKKRFCIGWCLDALEGQPRIITGFRKDE